MRNVRIFFEKKDIAKYISHLDLMRCFSRAIKRAGISIWYTEGFNPRPFMTFSLPLSLGTESFCESVDVRITDEMTDGEIVKRLNGAMPTGIVVTSASEPVHKSDEIRWARFIITLETNDRQEVLESVKNKISASEIIVEKQGKKGRKKVLKQIDIKGDISSYELCECENGVELAVVLSAGMRNNINPTLLLDAVTSDVKELIEAVDIVKEKMYLEDMSEFC